MAIRIRTLKYMGMTGRRLVRVRRRCYDVIDGEHVLDRDGKAGDPDTWGRYEVEFFSALHTARAARDPDAKWRPKGVIDHVSAASVWRELAKVSTEEELSTFDEGRLRLLSARVVSMESSG